MIADAISASARPAQGGWTPARVTWAQAAALAPPLAVALASDGTERVALLILTLGTALGWEWLFAVVRRRPVTIHGLTTALIVAVLVPPSVPLWQVGVAMTMGVVLGELIFGGRGFGFLSAATVVLAFLTFSFPGTALLGGEWIALAALPGAVLLVSLGLVSWRVIVAALVAFAAAALATGATWAPVGWGAGLAFGLVFLVADPAGAAATNPGRWLYGTLAGALVVLFDGPAGGGAASVALVFAALIAQIFAPLIDQAVVLALAWKRGRRHG
jgi:Na+-transporting NADH:ubiquinone oxidoreductase subunit B